MRMTRVTVSSKCRGFI